MVAAQKCIGLTGIACRDIPTGSPIAQECWRFEILSGKMGRHLGKQHASESDQGVLSN